MADGNRAKLSVPAAAILKVLPPDTGSFLAIAETRAPLSWTCSDFSREVASPKSLLRAFISGDVQDITCYWHRYHYLLMRVHIVNEQVPIVWLRMDKRLYESGTIQFSADRSKLWKPRDDKIMAATFASLDFRHVIDLLNNVTPTTDLDSRWYTSVVIGMLHGGFGGSWVKPPSPDWVKITLGHFVRHATTVESVERQFAIRHPNANKISLGDPETWKSGPVSLFQPPSSKRDGPEEDLQEPRPMPSPNANSAVPAAATNTEKNRGDQSRGPEINGTNITPLKFPTQYSLHPRSILQIGTRLSSLTDERRPVQPTNPSSTPTPPKEASRRIDEVTSIPRDVVITAPSTEPLGRGPQASPPFTNPKPSPPETPNLTGRIRRLGSTPMTRGGYSSVWRGSLLSTTLDNPDLTIQVALKVLHASYTDESTLQRKLHKHLHIEMRIWAQLHHENVVRLLGHTDEPEGPGLVSILYLHGDVLSFLAKNPSVNREIICADVALGLQYLHEHKPQIIHGDLKGRNVLIDGEGRASICDFGLSLILDGEPTGYTSSNFGGSLRFLAPELLEESTKTVETDMYTYGCTCIEILFDQEPYHKLSKEAHIIRAILSYQPPFEPLNEEVAFPSFLRILKRCWDHDPRSRPPLNLIIDTIQRCLYRTYRTNLGIHQGIGRHVRFICLPGIEQGTLISVADDGLSIVVNSSPSLHRVPIYQRYRWEFMDRQNLEESEDASSSERLPYVSKWTDYSVKFRLPYSSAVSYESYHNPSS